MYAINRLHAFRLIRGRGVCKLNMAGKNFRRSQRPAPGRPSPIREKAREYARLCLVPAFLAGLLPVTACFTRNTERTLAAILSFIHPRFRSQGFVSRPVYTKCGASPAATKQGSENAILFGRSLYHAGNRLASSPSQT